MQTWNLDIRWELSGTIASGIALKILSIDNTDDLEDAKELYEEHLERRLFEKAKLISAKLKWLKTITGKLLECDWPEEELIESETEKLGRAEKEIALNLTNPVDLMISQNPDLDEQEAARRYIRNARVNALLKKGKISEDTLMAALADVSASEVVELIGEKEEKKPPAQE